MALERVRRRVRETLGARIALGIAALTLVLTCAFLGVLAFTRPGTPDVGSRLGFYVLATAVVFVVAVVRLDDREREGTTVLSAVTVVAVVAFFLVGLAVEGVIYAVEYPDELVASQLLLYFLAAALICTGLGVWGLRHWREFASGSSNGE